MNFTIRKKMMEDEDDIDNDNSDEYFYVEMIKIR